MKARSEVANRYAKALFSLSTNGKRETILEDLRKIYQVLTADKHTKQLIETPVITRAEKGLVVEKVLGSVKLLDEVANFVRLLAQKDRLALLDQIVDALEDISDESNNVLRGVIRSAAPLKAADQEKIEEAISKVTKKQLILDYEEDKNLIGGVVANVGSYAFDGTVKTQLRKLKENLIGPRS